MNSTIEKILPGIASADWQWDRSGVKKVLDSLGWQHIALIGERDDYRTPTGVPADAYYHDGRCFAIEVHLEVFSDVDELDAYEYEAKRDEFYEKWKAATDMVTQQLGKPSFSDGAGAKGFPDDQEAEWVSLWKKPMVRIMVQQKNEGRDVPFRICLELAPPA